MGIEQITKMRDAFSNLAGMLDEMIVLYNKEEDGEEVDDKELQLLLGKFMMAMIELEAIK